MKWTLRDYQTTAKNKVESALGNGSTSTLLVMPTGTGKTQTFLSVAQDWPQGDVLVLAHRQELVWQPFDRWKALTGEHGEIEMGDFHRSTYSSNRSRITFASKDSLFRHKRLRRAFPDPKSVGLVIIDEAHHAVKQNKSYQKILDYLDHPDLRVLGVTATPDRSDEIALGQTFDSVAYDYPLLSLDGGPSAIGDGWLVPIRQEYVVVDGLDFTAVNSRGGDFVNADLERELTKESILHRLTAPTIEIAGNKKTAVFAAGVKQASRMSEIFNRLEDSSSYCLVSRVDKEDDHDFVIQSQDKHQRSRLLKRFGAGAFQYLCSVGCLTEGYDEPSLEMLCMGRMTRSRSLYCQMVGRGTRPLTGIVDGLGTPEKRKAAIAASAKPHVHVLDFVGNSRHPLISSLDILGGQYPDEVVAEAKKKLEESGGEESAEDLLAATVVEREKRVLRRQAIRSKASYKQTSVDPFDVIGVISIREPGWHAGRQPTEKQKSALEKFGVEPHLVDRMSFWNASKMMDNLIDRSTKKMATYKQCKLLKKHKVDTASLTMGRAGQLITRLKQNGWRYL